MSELSETVSHLAALVERFLASNPTMAQIFEVKRELETVAIVLEKEYVRRISPGYGHPRVEYRTEEPA